MGWPRLKAIELVERGPATRLDFKSTRALIGHGSWSGLVAGGIVEPISQSDGLHLRADRFVGFARLGDIELRIRERHAGSLVKLLELASNVRLKLAPAASGVSDQKVIVHALVVEFVELVRTYVAHGREKVYTTVLGHGPTGRGQLDLVRTARARAQGQPWLEWARPELSAVTPLNALVARALHAADLVCQQVTQDSKLQVELRSLAGVFQDNALAYSLSTAEDLLAQAERNRAPPGLPELAATIVQASSAGGGGHDARVSWFVNLETLFEKAVRTQLARVVPSAKVAKGGTYKPALHLFSGPPKRLPMYPDIVVSHTIETVVGDVKYKRWDSTPSASDLYQMSCYVQAHGGTRGFLVYPGSRLRVPLGKTPWGSSVQVFLVDPMNLEADLAWLAAAMDLPGRAH